jgi:hypothetical protein
MSRVGSAVIQPAGLAWYSSAWPCPGNRRILPAAAAGCRKLAVEVYQSRAFAARVLQTSDLLDHLILYPAARRLPMTLGDTDARRATAWLAVAVTAGSGESGPDA